MTIVAISRRGGQVLAALAALGLAVGSVPWLARGVSPRGSASGAHPRTVYAVNYPLKYFAERIAGGSVPTELPTPADVDPALWVPGTTTVLRYQRADLVLLNGATYARWLGRVSLPQAKLIDTSRGFRDRYLPLEETMSHRHGPEGAHGHGGTAFTTWLDPTLAIEQARAIEAAFARRWPAEAPRFRAGLESLERDLRELDRRIDEVVSRDPRRPLVFSHPVYQYLIGRYGLNARSLHWEPDAMPDATEWDALTRLLSAHPAKWMIWEGPPVSESRRRLGALGIRSVVFDPCANVPEDGDFLSVMGDNVDALARVFDGSDD